MFRKGIKKFSFKLFNWLNFYSLFYASAFEEDKIRIFLHRQNTITSITTWHLSNDSFPIGAFFKEIPLNAFLFYVLGLLNG